MVLTMRPKVVRALATRSAGEPLASRWRTTWALATRLRRLAASRISWSHCSLSNARSRPARTITLFHRERKESAH
jgi:hypothetical protein